MKRSNQWAPVLTKGTVAIALALAAGSAMAGQSSDQTDRIILKYRTSGVSAAQAASASGATVQATVMAQRQANIAAVAARFGGSVHFLRQGGLGTQIYQLDRRHSLDDVKAMAAQIAKGDANIEYAEPDRMMHAMAATPNDTSWSSQWDLQNSTAGVNAPAAWDLSTGSGVVVAVIDTGYRPHADLAANIVSGGGYDMISDAAVSGKAAGRHADGIDVGDWTTAGQCETGSTAENSSWHGTHVAGTIAARTNNSLGVAGIAYNAKILPVRVLGHCGGYTSDIADGMIWASGGAVAGIPTNTTPARVINMSLGGGGACDATSQNAINAARANGTVVVVAAGNESQDVSNSNPANCAGVVAVAAYGKTGARAYYSNYGTLVDLAGPGGAMNSATDPNGILSTMNGGTTTPGADTYAYYQGTSMATPHVAGVAALMIAAKPSLTPDQVESLLKSSARPFVASCSGCGTGMLDAYAAVQAALGGTTQPPASETESNNTQATANVVAAATTLNATMGSSSDVDYFRVDLAPGKTLTATMTPNSSSDYDLYVYNSAGTLIGSSEKGTGTADSVAVTNTGSSTFARYVKVIYYAGGTGATSGKYTVKLAW